MENSLNWVIINDSKSSQIEYKMAKMTVCVRLLATTASEAALTFRQQIINFIFP